jgi:putative transposase
MATHRMPPTELLDHLAAADTDALRLILEHTLQRLIEAEATTYIRAAPGEHTPERRTYRNGPSSEDPRYAHGAIGPANPQAADGQLLPEPAGATTADRAGAAGGDPGGPTCTG